MLHRLQIFHLLNFIKVFRNLKSSKLYSSHFLWLLIQIKFVFLQVLGKIKQLFQKICLTFHWHECTILSKAFSFQQRISQSWFASLSILPTIEFLNLFCFWICSNLWYLLKWLPFFQRTCQQIAWELMNLKWGSTLILLPILQVLMNEVFLHILNEFHRQFVKCNLLMFSHSFYAWDPVIWCWWCSHADLQLIELIQEKARFKKSYSKRIKF